MSNLLPIPNIEIEWENKNIKIHWKEWERVRKEETGWKQRDRDEDCLEMLWESGEVE